MGLLKGQSVSQTTARRRNEPPPRPEPRVSESLIANELTSERMSDPEEQLARRLRGGSTSGAPHSRGAEVFRE